MTNQTTSPMQTSMNEGEKYRVVAPEAMHETFMSDSEEEGGRFIRFVSQKITLQISKCFTF